MKTLYALVPLNDKKQLRMMRIICMARSVEELETAIDEEYWGTKTCMAKGSVYEMKDYMKDKVKIKLQYEII